jgi:hypothetical protein
VISKRVSGKLLDRPIRFVSHSARKYQIAKGRSFRLCVGVHASCPLDRD